MKGQLDYYNTNKYNVIVIMINCLQGCRWQKLNSIHVQRKKTEFHKSDHKKMQYVEMQSHEDASWPRSHRKKVLTTTVLSNIHCVQKKTPTHIFFHNFMNDKWILTKIAVNIPKERWILKCWN